MAPRSQPSFDASVTSRVLDYRFVPLDQRLAETIEWMRRIHLV